MGRIPSLPNSFQFFCEAISTCIQTTSAGIQPDNFAFPAVLKAIADLQDLNAGKQVHAAALKLGCSASSLTVGNTLVNMYGKCGDLGDVCKVFKRITEKDQVSWNSLIASLCRFEEWELALEAFRLMQLENMEHSYFSLVSVALACSNIGKRDGLQLGKQVHGHCLRIGDDKTFTNNALMAMYPKLGKVDKSKAVFELFANHDKVSWNTMISLFSQNARFYEALLFPRLMLDERLRPDGVTISSFLPACSNLELLDIGKEIHAYALRNDELIENSFVGSALVGMYCNCRQVESGRRVFNNFIDRKLGLWNAMIAGCVQCEEFSDREGIHGYVVKLGFEKDVFVKNAIMDMHS
ncbi:pentatricopeptide repeat-containing protein At3g57430, chloroplastic-like [Malania oleifera]|uniref:pentatricopeptide repeat-containing protein At3g57430, chloroplastic-like n=1 Tax=Malania oleifera TaxID=397392 RepID=UPI0025AEABEB|nr:pentatricopeptide repeat-containing protein At3g57430, chloroplastic-like [Malania oleifera]